MKRSLFSRTGSRRAGRSSFRATALLLLALLSPSLSRGSEILSEITATSQVTEGGTHGSVIGMNWRDPDWLKWIRDVRRTQP